MSDVENTVTRGEVAGRLRSYLDDHDISGVDEDIARYFLNSVAGELKELEERSVVPLGLVNAIVHNLAAINDGADLKTGRDMYFGGHLGEERGRRETAFRNLARGVPDILDYVLGGHEGLVSRCKAFYESSPVFQGRDAS